MTFEQYPTGIDTPPELENLRGLTGMGAFGVGPLLIAGGVAAAGATIAAWLADPDWSTGEYNDYMLAMDQSIKELDKLGWSSGCWQKNPAKMRQWKDFWARFSKHYGEYGRQSVYLSDAAEKPARTLLKTLAGWTDWFEKNCGIDIGPSVTAPGGSDPSVIPHVAGAVTEWTPLVKWGAIGLGALVVLNVLSGIRGVIPRQR